MDSAQVEARVRDRLSSSQVEIASVEQRTFPGEHWVIVEVPEQYVPAAQAMAGELEVALNAEIGPTGSNFVVLFRQTPREPATEATRSQQGRLSDPRIDQLIQLLEARSRTSDALPSLNYVEDPRASLTAVIASRHQLIFGRRGVGKTALLLEAKRRAEGEGHQTVWLNAHGIRNLDEAAAFGFIAEQALDTLAKHGAATSGSPFERLASVADDLREARKSGNLSPAYVDRVLPDLNQSLRSVLRAGLIRLYIFIDDFYLLPMSMHPRLLDNLSGMLRDCDGWLKIASIERLTRLYEPHSRIGVEIPHDASKIDLDITLEDAAAAQSFLESVLQKYTQSVGIERFTSISKKEARGRLVLGSGGVPRDYLNLLASSIVVAREARSQPREVGKEDVAVAAGRAARAKKRDLELDVSSDAAAELLNAQATLARSVQDDGYTYFRVDISQQNLAGYELLSQLTDLRFAHIVQSALSDQHKGGTKYEVYVLDLSEYSDVRLKRNLNVIDLEEGRWTWRLTGKARTMQRLTGTQLRDKLRQSPLVDVSNLEA